jgi:hypothetical protein
MSLTDLIPEDKKTDWDSVTCPNCQTHEELKLVNRDMKCVICKNEGCRVNTFQVSEENQ